jgi:hypothetical protein
MRGKTMTRGAEMFRERHQRHAMIEHETRLCETKRPAADHDFAQERSVLSKIGSTRPELASAIFQAPRVARRAMACL